MHRKNIRLLRLGLALLGLFALWTWLICHVDVRPAGETGTAVGFAGWNTRFHQFTGVHMAIYTATDALGLVPVLVCLAFAALGLGQLIRRRSLWKADRDLLLLGGYYILVVGCYLAFEMYPINYRPILIEGRMEASYPSSTTLLVLSVMPTLVVQARKRWPALRWLPPLATVFSLAMVAARLLCGVHWLTDIVGGILLSGGLACLYRAGTQEQ